HLRELHSCPTRRSSDLRGWNGRRLACLRQSSSGTVLRQQVWPRYPFMAWPAPFPSVYYDAVVCEKERNGPMTIVILGIDLGKNSCSVVGVDATGRVVTRGAMRRQTLIDYVAKLPVCVVAMEACCGAH